MKNVFVIGVFFAAFVIEAAAVPVEPPVQRTITDQFERTTEVRVMGVTADAIEIVRDADRARFNIPLQKLSLADQEFAADLLKKKEVSKPLPDTEWLQAIRRDFQRYDAQKKQFLPLGADAYAHDAIIVVAFTLMHDPPRVFDPVVFRVLPNGDTVSAQTPDQAPVLWIFIRGELDDFHAAAQKLPERHAMISYVARERAKKLESPIRSLVMREWLKRNPAPPSPTPTGRPIELSEEEFEGLRTKLLKIMPVYWFEPSSGSFGTKTPTPFPLFAAFYRDGRPVMYNGAAVKGSRQQVMSVLRGRASSLE